MKAGIAVAVALVAAMGCGQAIAANGDGNQLMNECTPTLRKIDGGEADNYYEMGHCLGLTQGVRQAMMIQNEGLPAEHKTCFRDGMTNGQGVRIVMKYLQDHPAELQDPAAELIYKAYRFAYPCK